LLADAIATRRDLAEADEACTILATVVLVTYRRALMRWLAGPASVDPRKVIDEAFNSLAAGLNPSEAKPRRRVRSAVN
jgi:hypothetical protein